MVLSRSPNHNNERRSSPTIGRGRLVSYPGLTVQSLEVLDKRTCLINVAFVDGVPGADADIYLNQSKLWRQMRMFVPDGRDRPGIRRNG